ncbi:MAG: FAD:protein FMN transferase [Verrucomicrobia bacterium]|nr:FAD:protein FMN transferase [Verrucomicrobiota bacterium]
MAPPTAALQRFEFTEPHMGTLFNITLFAPDAATAERAAKLAFARITKLDRVMTDYDDASELMRLCAQPYGTPVRVSDDLFDILQTSRRFSEMTGGAFDITVGPCVQLWRRARRQRQLPAPEKITTALAAVGWRKVQLDAHHKTVTLLAPEMRLDLGGIAKGYAADKALAVLKKNGISRALVAASGDIAIGEPPPGQPGWRIGIGSIDAAGNSLTKTVLLHNAAVSTSGDTEQFVELGGVRYSHIINPLTGRALTNRIGVTVIAKTATTTDGLETPLSVLGVERGMQLVEAHPELAVLFVTLEGNRKTMLASSRFRKISTSD